MAIFHSFFCKELMKGLDLQIETRHQDTGMPYIDVVVEFAAENGLDVEDIVKELHPSTVDKIKVEFIEKKMVKGERIETRIADFMD